MADRAVDAHAMAVRRTTPRIWAPATLEYGRQQQTGIGVMNVMLVSVTERTREIGLRKAVGGRRRDIMSQFLTEAVALATVGGVIGIVLGYSICSIASLHPDMVDIAVPVWVVAIALGFSAGVGVLFGMIPAFKAAIVHPIDALRHE